MLTQVDEIAVDRESEVVAVRRCASPVCGAIRARSGNPAKRKCAGAGP
jgi:hypothetical protein